MKLYTEEQIKEAMGAGMHIGYSNQFNIDNITNEVDKSIKYLTPIELPSDEEIEKQTNGFMFEKNKEVFYNGAKWMKEQIFNQNK